MVRVSRWLLRETQNETARSGVPVEREHRREGSDLIRIAPSRFKGLDEMNPNQLKETTMDPASRSLIRITLPAQYEDRQPVKDLVERLMGRDPAQRFAFIQNRAAAVDEDAIDA